MTDDQSYTDSFISITDSQHSSNSFTNPADSQVSPDSYTDVTETSWLQRLSGSVVGVFFGLMLLIGAPWLLWWNEGNEIRALKGLSSAEHSVVAASSTAIDPTLNGKLVYLTGDLTAAAPPEDKLFGVTAAGQARLQRHVEMYQWRESSHSDTQKHLGGGQQTVTTYTYNKVWSEAPIASQTFHHPYGHINPVMAFTTTAFDAANLRIGVYTPDQNLIQKLTDFQPIDPVTTMAPDGFHRAEMGFYKGADENNPQIGDIRVSFKGVRLQTVSTVAVQNDALLFPFFSKTGSKIELIEAGLVPPETLFHDEETKLRIWAWAIRAGCLLMIYLGIRLILAPLTLLGAFIPFFEDIADVAVGLVAAALSIVLFCGIIFLSWIVFRPLWAGLIVLAGVACCYGLLRHRANKRKAKVSFLGGVVPKTF